MWLDKMVLKDSTGKGQCLAKDQDEGHPKDTWTDLSVENCTQTCKIGENRQEWKTVITKNYSKEMNSTILITNKGYQIDKKFTKDLKDSPVTRGLKET